MHNPKYVRMVLAAFAGILLMASAGASYSQTLDKLALCSAMHDWLHDPTYQLDARTVPQDCIKMELVVLSSDDWEQFVQRFGKRIHREGYPVLLEKSFREFDAGNWVSSFAYADRALINATKFFARSGDEERRNFYISFLTAWRSIALAKLVTDPRQMQLIARLLPRGHKRVLPYSYPNTQNALRCIVQSDPLIGSLEVIAQSPRVRNCLEGY